MLGEYVELHSGRVYFGYERPRNVAQAEIDPTQPLLWALDFNVDPMSSLIAQVSGSKVTVIDEIVLSRASTYQACEEFETRFREHAAGLTIYADASGARLQTTGTTDVKILKEFLRCGRYDPVEFKIPKSNPVVRDRVMLMNVKLAGLGGETPLQIDPRCKELVKDFEQVSYKENSQVIDKERDSRRTHLSDALGYLVWQEMPGCNEAGREGERLVSDLWKDDQGGFGDIACAARTGPRARLMARSI